MGVPARLAVLAALVAGAAQAFEAHKFKKCADNAFCRRHRALADSPPEARGVRYVADASTFELTPEGARVVVASSHHAVPLELRLVALNDGSTVRLRVREVEPLFPRFEPPHVLLPTGVQPSALRVVKQDAREVRLALGPEGSAGGSVVLEFSPLRVRFFAAGGAGEDEVATFNARGLFEFEHYRAKEEGEAAGKEEVEGAAAPEDGQGETSAAQGAEGAEGAAAADAPAGEAEPAFAMDTKGQWEERFGDHTDTKPKGPAAFGFDVRLPGFDHVYGLPEHATSLNLKDTRGEGAPYAEPYRLFNLDVFEYDLDSPFGLYGSVPLLLAHARGRSAGVFLNTASELYVDVHRAGGPGGAGATETHWVAESGALDLFVLLEPTPRRQLTAYARLTGTLAMPPLFATSYHQCRWNYNDEADVRAVDQGFEDHDIPYDVLWLDIEHTDGKRYFTWDARKFPAPAPLQEHLAVRGHRTVVIIDPHIKVDDKYPVYAQAKARDLFVRTHANATLEGWCWPGSSSYLDFLREDVRAFWGDQLQLSAYAGSTRHLFVWNDMNEPSVFNGPEVTMQKDALHALGTVEHRDVHNLYGHLQVLATRDGLLRREAEGPAGAQRRRPFVLTRSFYAGSQRLAAVWTGDNMAKWEHLAAATPMLLSLGIGGISFCGADVGGFFYNPDPELLVRWYQAGAFQPFFRAHAHIETKRREPWLLGEPHLAHIREAVRRRYRLLPYVYTLFASANADGVPVMRPFFLEFPDDGGCFAEDAAFLLGPALLVRPVAEAGATEARLRLPGAPQDVWFDSHDGAVAGPGGAEARLAAPADRIPVLQRGGTIVPRKERARRSSALMLYDPFTLVVAPDRAGEASGELYLDDGESYAFEDGDFAWRQLAWAKGRLSSAVHPGRPRGAADAPARVAALRATVERVVVLGTAKAPARVTAEAPGQPPRELTFTHDAQVQVLTIRKPDLPIAEDWAITLH